MKQGEQYNNKMRSSIKKMKMENTHTHTHRKTLELKNTMTELKNLIGNFNKLNQAAERISDLKDII